MGLIEPVVHTAYAAHWIADELPECAVAAHGLPASWPGGPGGRRRKGAGAKGPPGAGAGGLAGGNNPVAEPGLWAPHGTGFRPIRPMGSRETIGRQQIKTNRMTKSMALFVHIFVAATLRMRQTQIETLTDSDKAPSCHDG